jgi:DUF1009 family protein
MVSKIGIYAGKGTLPIKVAQTITDSGKDVFIIAIKGLTNKDIERFPHKWLRFGQIGAAMKMLRKNYCDELVIIGGAHIPNFFLLFPDFSGLKLFFSLFKVRKNGDASIIKTIINYIEVIQGIKVTGADVYLTDILMPKGTITNTLPRNNSLNDIRLAEETCMKVGAKDDGQACLVANGKVIAVEDINGTDFMLYEALNHKIDNLDGGFLMKTLKPIQDPRVDLPTVGIDTLKLINQIGLSGIVLQSNKAFIVDKKEMIDFANANNLFIHGV